jgi:hypothetical protein
MKTNYWRFIPAFLLLAAAIGLAIAADPYNLTGEKSENKLISMIYCGDQIDVQEYQFESLEEVLSMSDQLTEAYWRTRKCEVMIFSTEMGIMYYQPRILTACTPIYIETNIIYQHEELMLGKGNLAGNSPW